MLNINIEADMNYSDIRNYDFYVEHKINYILHNRINKANRINSDFSNKNIVDQIENEFVIESMRGYSNYKIENGIIQ